MAAGTPLALDLSLEDLERDARHVIGEMAYAYYAGGADDERLLEQNVAAWAHWQLHPKVLAGICGRRPLHHAAGHTRALARGDRADGHPGTGARGRGGGHGERCRRARSIDGALLVGHVLPRGSGRRRSRGRPLDADLHPSRPARTVELVQRAEAHGYGALVLTVDAPVPGLRLRELRGGVHLPHDLALPNLVGPSTESAREGGFMAVSREFEPALTPDDIGWLAGLTSLPVVVKGVQRADDAVRCVDAGAAAVIVSNHGARQLADAPPTADILREVVDAVGDRAEVYVDGGLRRAPDVVKALALGARAVFIGRPSLWALAAGGADGVASLLQWYESELRRAMALCGAATVSQLERSCPTRSGWSLDTADDGRHRPRCRPAAMVTPFGAP